MKGIVLLIGVFAVCFTGCREEYLPKVTSSEQSFLVIEGNLNASHDTTVIRLTRTFKLDDTATLNVENNALVTVEGSDNTIRSLIESGDGKYISPDLNLNINTDYRLRIRTVNAKEYLSNYVKARKTPAIDSISWEKSETGVGIFASTSDPSNASRYYRWEFDETWEIRSYFHSYVIYDNGWIRPRNMPAEDVSVCWKYNQSRTILLANSTRLQDDVIYKFPLTNINKGDEKLAVRYSIMVKQYALDKDAYSFYELMQRNTEDIGSIFAPQPSEIRGNIHCMSDPNEYVLGYITASTEEKQRIFIERQWVFQQDCPEKKVPKIVDSVVHYFGSGFLIPYEDVNFPDPHFKGAPSYCVDCTTRGGSQARPSYW